MPSVNAAKARLLSTRVRSIYNETPAGDPTRAECLVFLMYLCQVIEGGAAANSCSNALQEVEAFCENLESPLEGRLDLQMFN